MNISDELDDFINKICIVKRNKKSQGKWKWFCRGKSYREIKELLNV